MRIIFRLLGWCIFVPGTQIKHEYISLIVQYILSPGEAMANHLLLVLRTKEVNGFDQNDVTNMYHQALHSYSVRIALA